MPIVSVVLLTSIRLRVQADTQKLAGYDFDSYDVQLFKYDLLYEAYKTTPKKIVGMKASMREHVDYQQATTLLIAMTY